MIWDPKKRSSAQDILCHPFLSDLHDEADEPNANFVFDWSLIDQNIELENWKILIETVFHLLTLENQRFQISRA